MSTNIFIEMIHNATMLMSLIVVYEVSYYVPIKYKKIIPILNGFVIGLIGLAIMSMPLILKPGVVFDTRSILLGVTALTFGTIPTVIAAIITAVYRIMDGGVGAIPGIFVITFSSLIGLFWRNIFLNKIVKYRWLNIYIFGVIIHIVMLVCMLLMPWDTAIHVLRQISLPVMLIYPVGTVILSQLLFKQKERNESLIRVFEAEESYKSLFENSHAVMLIYNPDDGKIIDANIAASKFYGWSLSEIKNMKIQDINTLTLKEIITKIKNKSYNRFKHRRSHGSEVDVEVYSGLIMQKGKTYIYSIVHDVSDRIAAINALKDSEERFRILVESAPDAIFIHNDNKFYFANKAAIELFGASSAQQLIGSPVIDRVHPDFRNIVRELISKINNQNETSKAKEEKILRFDGTAVDVDVTAVPIHYNQLDGVLVFARDITERRLLEAEKINIEAQLRQQQKLEAIGTLAGGVAHEINNPLNGIMNYAQLIHDDVDKKSDKAKYATEIIHETERISEIVKSLLQFSRQEKQSHSYASIYDIVNQTLSLVNTIIKKDQIILELDIDKNLPEIKCRSQQIQQVLMNLITNARDALNEKYKGFDVNKIIKVSCSQFSEEDRKWLRLIVEDNGIGIPENLREKIFEPFFSTKPKDKGTGLGLSISFGIIKEHHGKISIESKEKKYTKFIVDLPVDNGWEL